MTPDPLGAWFATHPAALAGLLAILGLVIGSFLNVVILRLPEMLRREWTRDCRALLEIDDGASANDERLSLSYPGSHCPRCGAAIKPWQNVPVLSFLVLRGRCARCRAPIGLRYPLTELATAVATVIVGLVVPWGPELAAYLLLTWCLVALTGIDIDTQLLPDDITVPLLWAGLLFNLTVGPVSLEDAVIGAIGGYLLLWSVYWLFRLATGKEGMGFGDFKLLAALGAWLGWQDLPLIILLSSVVGAVLGIVLITLRGQSRHQPLPFGPYLAAAGWITLLWGDRIGAVFLPGMP